MHDHTLEQTPEELRKQQAYRDARFSKQYDGIWQNVGKCVFCDLNDKYVFFEENGVVLTITLYAYIDGHMMIIPRRHVQSAKELTSAEWETIRKCTYIAKKLIKEVHGISGMQLVQKDGADAQSTVEHIHFHAIPFDAPDLASWNFRKLANTPLENVALYRQQQKKIASLAKKFDEKYSDNTGHASEPVLTTTNPYNLRWSEIAFGDKRSIRQLKATFIAAPRQLSTKRFIQMVKAYLPKSNIVLGLAEEFYIAGFEGQPQFKTLQLPDIEAIIDKVNSSAGPHKIYTLSYAQRDIQHLITKLDFGRAIFVNGSWKYSFHTLPIYYTLKQDGIPYELISPFVSEAEAKQYEQATQDEIIGQLNQEHAHNAHKDSGSDQAMLELAHKAAQQSYDYSFQTGVTLAKKTTSGYKPLISTFNKVVPYQTYAMHHGASRETHFSAPHDLNHYDAVHAEVELIVQAAKQGIDLAGTTLFINLLPCPSCARMFCETDIAEFVYSLDHSDGYAVQLLEQAGKVVRRIVPTSNRGD